MPLAGLMNLSSVPLLAARAYSFFQAVIDVFLDVSSVSVMFSNPYATNLALPSAVTVRWLKLRVCLASADVKALKF